VESSFLKKSDSLLFEARLIDVEGGEVLEGMRATAALADPMAGIQALRDRLMVNVATRLKLGDQYASSYGRGQSFEAWQHVDAARELWAERGREREAFALLYQALAIDSTFDAAVGLAMIWHINFGEFSRADSMATVLEERIAFIPPKQRWQLAVNRAVLRRDRAGMLDAFREWKDRLPNAKRWLHLASAEGVAHRPRQCLDALDSVDLENDRYARSAWRWVLYARCHHALGSYDESLRYAREGRDRFPEDLDVVYRETRALAALGRTDEVGRLIDDYLSEPADEETFEHERRFALLVDPGLEMRAHGYPEAGTDALDRAVEWYRARTVKQASSVPDRWYLARALYAAGRWEEAREEFSALSPDELVGESRLISRATLAARLGDHDTAVRIDEELVGLSRALLWGHATYWRAVVAAVRGEEERAVELLGQAMTEGLFALQWGAEYPKWDFHIDPDFESLRDYPPFQELIAPRG